MGPTYAAFTEIEHRERVQRAREALAVAGLDACICVGPEHLFYLAGYDSIAYFNPQALVIGADPARDPVLVVRDVDRPLARETSWIADVRTYRLHAEDPVALVTAAVDELGVTGPAIGLDLRSFALTGHYALALADALSPLNVVDASALLGGLQYRKSPAEMVYVRRAATYARAGLGAARANLKPGVTEHALASSIEAAMRAAGSDYWAIPTELAGGPRSPGGHATPSARPIESGELVHAEFAGVARRYHAVAIHTMALDEPSSRAREVYELARESLAAGIDSCAPSVPVAHIDAASIAPLRREGLEDAMMMRFGVGIGIGYPPAWIGSFEIDRHSDQRLEAGMVFYLHTCLELPEEGIGVVQGGTFALLANGLEMLVGGGNVPLDVIH